MEQSFPAWLQAHLDASGLGVAEFARRIGVSQSMVSSYVNDKTRPERRTIRRLAAGLGVEPAEIEAILAAEEERRRGRHAPGLGPTGALSSHPAPGFDMLSPDSARFHRAVEAAAGGALRLLRGDPPEAVTEYLRSFESAVDAELGTEARGRGDARGGDPPGAGDPD